MLNHFQACRVRRANFRNQDRQQEIRRGMTLQGLRDAIAKRLRAYRRDPYGKTTNRRLDEAINVYVGGPYAYATDSLRYGYVVRKYHRERLTTRHPTVFA